MKIIKINKQIRKHIFVSVECEYCGLVLNVSGLNDTDFFEGFIPNKVCNNCKKTSPKKVFKNRLEKIKWLISIS